MRNHARHDDIKTTMLYNRPTQRQMKYDINRGFDTNNNNKNNNGINEKPIIINFNFWNL